MKIKELLPDVISNSADSFEDIFGVEPKDASVVYYHFDSIIDKWNITKKLHSIRPIRSNFTLFCLHYMSDMQQEFEKPQILMLLFLLGNAGVQLEEQQRGKDFNLSTMAHLITPLDSSHLESGSDLGYLVNMMFVTAKQTKVKELYSGRTIPDDVLIHLMAKTANAITPIGKLTNSDALRIAYCMGVCTTSLSFLQKPNHQN